MNNNRMSLSSPLACSTVQTPDGEILWNWIGAAFIVYWSLFAFGSLAGHKELNTLGGLIILAILVWAVVERLWVRADTVVFVTVAAMLIPLIHYVEGDSVQSGQAVFKYLSVCTVMAISRFLRLPVAFRSKFRWMLAVPVLFILLISIFVEKGVEQGGAARHSGLFLNPNNLALIPFLLLFLINEERDSLRLRIFVHAIVAGVLAFSGTSGAIIAYAIGLAIHLKDRLSARVRMAAVTIMLGTASIGTILVISGENVLPRTRLTTQLSVMLSEAHDALGGTLQYYDQERLLGAGAASGVWRLAHWRQTLDTFATGTVEQQLLGFGTGSSSALLDQNKLPHNEYLRLLFEQGTIGLLLFLFAWRKILVTAPASTRYAGLIVAIYSFSENNLDNFPFMSLFILFLSASAPLAGELIRRPWSEPRETVQTHQQRCLS